MFFLFSFAGINPRFFFYIIHLVYNICVITFQFQLSLSSTNETYLYQRKERRANIRAYQGLFNKTFLRHCSAKHCLRHGSGSGIYFHINASDLLLSLGAKAQTLHVVCPSMFSVFLNVLLCPILKK